MTNVWILETSLSSENLTAQLGQHLGTHDKLFVIRAHADFNGWVEEGVWNWLRLAVAARLF